MSEYNPRQQTLCWNCAKAVGYCPWSQDLEPIPGWTAFPTQKQTHGNTHSSSYLVIECPLFKRDALNNGLKRYKEGDTNDTKPKNP